MSLYNNINAGKLQVTGNVYVGVDLSGNLIADSSSNVASLNAVQVITNSLTANTINVDVFNFETANLDVSGNLIVGGTINTAGGFQVDASGNITANSLTLVDGTSRDDLIVDGSASFFGAVNMASTLGVVGQSTLGSVRVTDLSANNLTATTARATSLTTTNLTATSGIITDLSANKLTATSGTINTLIATSGTFNGPVDFYESNIMYQSLCLLGGAYINKEYTNELVVGDGSGGNGVTMESSGTTLNILGVTQDLSRNEFPITVNVTGGVSISNRLTATSGVVTDLSSNNLTATTARVTNLIATSGVVTDLSSNNLTATTARSTSLIAASGVITDLSANKLTATTATVTDLTVNELATFNCDPEINGSLSTTNLIVPNGGGAYINNEYVDILTVGDSLYGNGVTMESSGQTLRIYGVTQDTSALLFPVTVNVRGELSTTGGFSVDLSGNITASNFQTGITSFNTAVGIGALPVNTGFSNIAIGDNVLPINIGGSNNTVVGNNSLANNISGDQNTVIGYGTGEYNTGSNNIFLGLGADASGNVNNKIVIGNSFNDSITFNQLGSGSTPSIFLPNVVPYDSSGTTTPNPTTKWLPIVINGSTYYINLYSTFS
jgi:hypothetical protein